MPEPLLLVHHFSVANQRQIPLGMSAWAQSNITFDKLALVVKGDASARNLN